MPLECVSQPEQHVSQTSPVDLTYGRAPTMLKRRWFRKLVTLVIVSAATAVALPIGIQQVRRRAEMSYYARYSAPASELMYDDDPSTAALLMHQEGRYGPVGLFVGSWHGGGSRPVGRVIHFPGFPERRWPGLVFSHLRCPPGGRPLIVLLVTGSVEFMPDGYKLEFGANVFPEGSEWRDGPDNMRGTVWAMPVPRGQRLRFYAGQADPADESHFTVTYDMGSVPGTIDGWLRDPSDNGVELRVRSGPASLSWVHNTGETPNWQVRKP
jgi:hypothetical protein